jgi:hypothetical protein
VRLAHILSTAASALIFALILTPPSLFARCPIPAGGTLEVRAPAGNLIIDTSGTDSVDWDVTSKQIVAQETCGRDTVRIDGTAAGSIRPIPDWHIKVPRTVILDLVTQAGSITIGQSDGKVNARTGGGDVVVGNIRGEMSLYTEAGNIQAGDIGSNAAIKSNQSGNLILGNVSGEVTAWTQAGDITVASALKVMNMVTGGGNILIRKVIGSFKGRNEAGNIRIEQAGSWVEASTGSGNIYLRMVPDRLTGDLHVNLQAGGTGDITLFLPRGMKADIQTTSTGRQVQSDIPLIPIARGFQGLAPPPSPRSGLNIAPSRMEQQSGQVNGGGNPVKLHTSLGKIDIKLFN